MWVKNQGHKDDKTFGQHWIWSNRAMNEKMDTIKIPTNCVRWIKKKKQMHRI